MAAPGSGLTGPANPGAVQRLAEQVAAADGVAPLNEQSLLAARHRTEGYRHRWLAEGDDLLGYAVVDPEGSGELCVHPDHRRRGLGRQLLDTVLREEPGIALWAHGNLPGAQALARARGLRLTRELWKMARELGATSTAGGPAGADDDGRQQSPPGAPAGVGLRTFEPGQDEGAWVQLNAASFADHPEQGRLTVTDLRQRQAEPWFDPTLLWLAHQEGAPQELLASMWVKPDGADAEIYALGVAPHAQGRGLGRWLTEVALEEMVRRGFRRSSLYVEGDNTPAVRTYHRSGYERVALDVQYSP